MTYRGNQPLLAQAMAPYTGTATTGQSYIPVPGGVVPGMNLVGVGGAWLAPGDFSDSDGLGIALAAPMAAGTQWQVVAFSQNTSFVPVSGQLAPYRNKIINGKFQINQRAVTGTVNLAAGAYGHDRWRAGVGGCTYTFVASGNETVITITAGTLQQVIEGGNIAGGVHALSHTGTAQARIGVNWALPSGGYAAATKNSPLLSAPASGGQNVTIEFSTGTISSVQLEPGSVATAFEDVEIGETLRRCQRYYEVSGGLVSWTQPGNSGSVTQRATFGFKVSKRASPSVTPAISVGNTSVVGVSNECFVVGSSGTAMQENSFSWTASAEL